MRNKDKELEYEIEILKRDIIQFERDINRNAEDHYDGYKHSVLIDKIKIRKERIDNINSELKGRQDREKEVIEDEKEYLEFLLSNRLHPEYSIRDLRREILDRLSIIYDRLSIIYDKLKELKEK